MKSRIIILTTIILSSTFTFSQNCDCKKNFEWVKKTFEENDAGFAYAVEKKGKQAYEAHNLLISQKIKSTKKLSACTSLLYEWLTFFRSGHIAITLNEQVQNQSSIKKNQVFTDWETHNLEIEDFKKLLDIKEVIDYEGIWQSGSYVIGIKKENEEYIGIIIESEADSWTKGQLKLKFSIVDNKANSVFYLRDHTAVNSNVVLLTGNNHLQIGDFSFKRSYPEIKDEPKFEQYFMAMEAQNPYIVQLNTNTLYLRIPSFQPSQKQIIDSVLAANKHKILTTENLIIDIRNGTGGSDGSYEQILPFLYTNPIRTVGVEFLSTQLNNQRMLDFISNPEYGFNEEDKLWAKTSFEKLEKHLGEFVNLDEDVVSITKMDTVFPYPINVGIIINQQNGSTDEQFLLAAKQSKKVKLFGATTYGVLDVSNMHFVTSPCKEFQLGYVLTKSMRIPDFTIDEKGIQPDYYFDRGIDKYEWIEFTNEILNAK